MAEQQDPEIPDVPEHDLSEEDMMFVSLLYNYILALEAEESVKERERAWGSLPSVTKPNKTCQSLIKAPHSCESVRVLHESVTKRVRSWWKRLTSCQIFMPDRSKSWDILTKRVKWWQTVKTGVPALNQALLSFPTLWVKLCWALLRFVKLWYALGALINSWQSA